MASLEGSQTGQRVPGGSGRALAAPNTDYERLDAAAALALVMAKYDRRYPDAPAFARSIVQGETRDSIARLAEVGLVVARQIDRSGDRP